MLDRLSVVGAQASARSASLGLREVVRLQEMDVENLKFPSDCFDTVVDTFSLCVFTDPVRGRLAYDFHPPHLMTLC